MNSVWFRLFSLIWLSFSCWCSSQSRAAPGPRAAGSSLQQSWRDKICFKPKLDISPLQTRAQCSFADVTEVAQWFGLPRERVQSAGEPRTSIGGAVPWCEPGAAPTALPVALIGVLWKSKGAQSLLSQGAVLVRQKALLCCHHLPACDIQLLQGEKELL